MIVMYVDQIKMWFPYKAKGGFLFKLMYNIDGFYPNKLHVRVTKKGEVLAGLHLKCKIFF